MTNDEARRSDKIRIIRSHRRSRIRHSGFVIHSSFNASPARTIRHSSFRGEGAMTIIELLVVIIIIFILAGLVLSISSYVQNKGARARAETEIAAISAGLESYKADNGIYPRVVDGSTDALDARASFNPSNYKDASLYLFTELSGLNTSQQPVANKKAYFTFRAQMLGHNPGDNVTVAYIRDPFGNSYGYSTANQKDSSKGYNPTFDLWSNSNPTPTPTVAPTPTPQNQWIKNW
jgi:type II secretory pathway pseudopilin PulG